MSADHSFFAKKQAERAARERARLAQIRLQMEGLAEAALVQDETIFPLEQRTPKVPTYEEWARRWPELDDEERRAEEETLRGSGDPA